MRSTRLVPRAAGYDCAVARDLGNSVVVITGASSGIGREAARQFAREGSRLVLAARAERPLRDAAAECERLGAAALAVPTDVRDERAVARWPSAPTSASGGSTCGSTAQA